jgi:hypothetical protein
MDVRPVDPRDTAWEIDFPSYRIYFWEPQAAAPGVPQQIVGFRSNEFEVSGVDVGEVLAWAEATKPPGSTYTIYAVIEGAGERGLVRLAGVDPTANDE